MLTKLLHWLVKQPRVYDATMTLLGARRVEQVLHQTLAPLDLSGWVIDVGGGTGMWKSLLPARCRHVCVDIDPLKLRGFLSKHGDGVAVLASATALPLADASVDAVLCVFVAHHLNDGEYAQMVEEAWRVLMEGGLLMLVDPLWEARRLPGRLLWRYDRGHYPRPLQAHRDAVRRRFTLQIERRFAVAHAYAVLIGRKSATTSN